jgi:hypothetical protein
MELPFAGMHQLCAPLLDQLDALTSPWVSHSVTSRTGS